MEQIFLLVNKILAANKETTAHELRLRTYRVVPLQPLAGVIEWIGSAQPIGDYLHGAHERRNPTDITPKEARAIMKKEFERSGSNPHTKYQVYREQVLARFQPAFRFFFIESTTSTQEWFARRLCYILSVAVGSIVGYIVGLGDRHCQNIMVDQHSGALIHIDLNMIFEMGKTLRIPERVPFRLTRDIVDGMGYAGLEAGFTGAAVKVTKVLRQKAEMMLMVIEAFKYDPLYRWSRKPPKASNSSLPDVIGRSPTAAPTAFERLDVHEEEEECDIPKEAERALLRVKEKLMGMEEGCLLSEQGQVACLIQQGTSEELLAQMYPGWQAWM